MSVRLNVGPAPRAHMDEKTWMKIFQSRCNDTRCLLGDEFLMRDSPKGGNHEEPPRQPPNQVKCVFTGNDGPLFRLPQMKSIIVPPLLRLPELQAPRESSCLMIFICHHVVPRGTKRHPTSQAHFARRIMAESMNRSERH